MYEKAEDQVESFRKAVENLFTDIESWLSPSPLKTRREEIQINEEASGAYTIQKLLIEDASGKKIAELVPVAAFVVSADGRVDLNGRYDKAIIFYEEAGGLSLTTSITNDGRTETSRVSLFKGIDKKGWYYIGDALLGRAHFVDKELFFDLLEGVSDYVIEKRS
ncbi:MAG: hypothetical protein AB1656_11005 [Candidatus Omnitrophota bacterium]